MKIYSTVKQADKTVSAFWLGDDQPSMQEYVKNEFGEVTTVTIPRTWIPDFENDEIDARSIAKEFTQGEAEMVLSELPKKDNVTYKIVK